VAVADVIASGATYVPSVMTFPIVLKLLPSIVSVLATVSTCTSAMMGD